MSQDMVSPLFFKKPQQAPKQGSAILSTRLNLLERDLSSHSEHEMDLQVPMEVDAFQSPIGKMLGRSNTLKNQPNLLGSGGSPVESVGHQSATVTESSRMVSSISSTASTASEVEKCKEVIFRALHLKKSVSEAVALTQLFRLGQ